ncbi:YqcC family protein [Martelella alba]|uniref:YqcC family protein n=1 Tax=Martelella alba TaxID=2590451 RepID=A0ABY2SK58_9HYPH|nr:YqcC family protein [Martelella alba]TKI05908.1 YqcC family protein [Martelella alba]
MELHSRVRQHLFAIEQVMKQLALWQSHPPARGAFDSREPFCIDTMEAQQWLQWILLPRMHALLDRQATLPTRFAIAPYFEEALPDAKSLLALLRQLDAMLDTRSSPD